MTVVVFYEKPGCLTNARQKALLRAHGCELSVRDLLSEPWTGARLGAFLEQLPVSHWFNPAAPRIKSGEIDPAAHDRHSALALLLSDPLLIRRPLLDTEFGKTAGFDDPRVLKPLGVYNQVVAEHRDCARTRDASSCPPPD
jgi:nitrogenase-associated protein